MKRNDLVVFAVEHAVFLPEVRKGGKHFEATRFHLRQHFHDPGFDAVAALLFPESRWVLEVLEEHVEPVGSELIRRAGLPIESLLLSSWGYAIGV